MSQLYFCTPEPPPLPPKDRPCPLVKAECGFLPDGKKEKKTSADFFCTVSHVTSRNIQFMCSKGEIKNTFVGEKNVIVFNGPPVSAFFPFGISCLHLLLLLLATPTILGRRQSSELLHKTLPGDKKRNYIRRIFLPASFSPSLFFSGALFQTRPRQNGCFRERRGFFSGACFAAWK